MKRNFLLGLVTTAALLLVAPVAASEIPGTTVPSTRQDVEEIRGMIRASQARQGIIQAVPETAPVASAPAPVAPASAPALATVTAPAPEPAPVPETAPVASAPAPVAPASAPAPAPAPESEPAPKPAPVAPATVPAPTPVPPRSVKDTASTITPPACLGRAYPKPSEGLLYELNRYDHMVCLLATDEAWRRADQKDYRLGYKLERGVPPLTAIGQYAPHLLPRALAILRGEENYT